MNINEIKAAFATIANNTKENHTREFALEQFNKLQYNTLPSTRDSKTAATFGKIALDAINRGQSHIAGNFACAAAHYALKAMGHRAR